MMMVLGRGLTCLTYLNDKRAGLIFGLKCGLGFCLGLDLFLDSNK